MRQLPEVPDGVDALLAIIKADHHRVAESTHLEFAAVEEEFGTRFEAAFESEDGTPFVLIEPAYEPELGVNVHVLPGTDLHRAESQLLAALQLEAADLAWRATVLHLNQGDIVSIDPEAAPHYHPDSVGVVIDIAYGDHPDLVSQPGVNSAVYSVQLEGGRVVQVPSNLLQWEPILHAESVRTAGGFANFLSTLAHHMVVQRGEWRSSLGAAAVLGGLITRLGEREAVAAQARSQLQPTWGLLAAIILEVVAPPSWTAPHPDDG